MFVDSHCHLDFPEFRDELPLVLDAMRDNAVTHALCIAVEMGAWPAVHAIARAHANLYASVGVHPDYADIEEPSEDVLVARSNDRKVVAIGETGLDYYRLEGDLGWQRDRFRTHIRAARTAGKPLVIHTREAEADTAEILGEAVRGGGVTGVLHCFTGSAELARKGLDLGFYVSLSGIVTFKNAADLQAIAKWLPAERMLVETDAPFLAPVPHRGQKGEPAFVADTARFVAELRGEEADALAEATTENFFRLFGRAQAA